MTDSPTLTRTDEKQTDPHQTFRAQVPPLLLLTSIFFVNFLARIVLAPLMPIGFFNWDLFRQFAFDCQPDIFK